ncbi:dipeptidase [Desulforamulus hydrothermalis]|uniref:Membrane dipeptidase n=1 Tax=Desulforamulus hydrothermalis Lam5 = DSM 18033 TaxID=1121428 RepID=K8ECI4_9FIRM|nr:Membrane dipeptidase [Desulforamulus hydrothermalis Lam5 = DSM 18033]SHH09285.1 dipeptidase. Metallo peptidase. MEROPS family M19 [Desulforamulus hydrothermalis Lam5 = DSM 18033]
MPVVDAHCDTLTVLAQQNRSLGRLSAQGHLDLPRLRKGGVDVQFFAIFVGPDNLTDPVDYTNELINLFQKEIKFNHDLIEHVTCYADIENAMQKNKIAAVLTIEGGEALNGRVKQLDLYYRLGVRGLTLTWNGRNELADGVGMGAAATGLTQLGRQVVQRMAQLGMIIDVSHLAEPGFWDVLAEVKIPVAATHSNCRQLCDHPRNLTDRQIKAIADRGGVIGVTYVPQFIDSRQPSLHKLLDHIDHLYKVGGISSIGLGSDFDGIVTTAAGLHDAGVAVPNLVRGLSARGYHTGDIEKILGNNWLRLFKEVCG